MDETRLKQILENVSQGRTSTESALKKLSNYYREDIDFANIDHHRSLRKGFSEVIFGEGKTADQIISIARHMCEQETTILATRVELSKAYLICEYFPWAVYHEEAGMVVWERTPLLKHGHGRILVVTAGTSDIPVAMEAQITADAMGNDVDTIYDVGVAGIHRLLAHMDSIQSASVIVVVAGMEGALPSVVAGLVSKPVIAVPTSVGYGTNFNGLTALLGMLNSCSSNVSVVNIDNGFGAGYMASCINHI